MKSIKQIALGAFLTISAFCAVMYTSCSKDKCKDVVCNNGGTCTDGACVCPTGYLGTNCDTRAFLGTWAGSDVCTPSGNYNVTIKLDPSSTDATRVLINNPGGFGTNVTISGTYSTNSKTITYINQVTGAVTLNGTMTLTDNTHFTHAYTAHDTTGGTSTCNGTYTKQ